MYSNPAKTITLLDALTISGFTDSAFAIIHHHNPAQSIADHRKYCALVDEGGDFFRTSNNRLIQRRLEMITTMYRSAGFASGDESIFINLAKAALIEVPHDTRPVSEQVAQ